MYTTTCVVTCGKLIIGLIMQENLAIFSLAIYYVNSYNDDIKWVEVGCCASPSHIFNTKWAKTLGFPFEHKHKKHSGE